MINDLAKNFIKYLDKNGNGTVELSEYQAYLKTQKMPLNMADKAITIFDKDGNGSLSEQELLDGYTSFDENQDGSMAFNEMLTLQNQLSEITIDTTISANQYNSLFSSASNFFRSVDITNDGTINTAEYQNLLKSNNYDINGAANFINFYDENKDGEVDLLEYQKKSIALDANKDGQVDTTEAQSLISQFRKLTNTEIFAKNLVKSLDGATGEKDADGLIIKDGVISRDEMKIYFNNYRMPAEMTDNLFNLYAGGGNTISNDQLVNAYNSFDADGNGTLSFSENLAFQNTAAKVKFDTTISQKQYTNLFNMASSFMKSADANKDGKVDVTEIRALIDAQNKNIKVDSEKIPEGYAENLIQLFDLDNNDPNAAVPDPNLSKDAGIDLFEYMKGVMKFDTNNDGQLNAAESLILKEQLYNTKLFDNVNKVFTTVDYNNDKNINLNEYKAYLVSQGLPAYLADEAIKQFDMDKDGMLSRVELMQAYKKFDINNNNDVDFDEKITYYDALSANSVNLGLGSSNVRQATNMFTSLQDYVKNNDWDNNALLNKNELTKYFTNQNLPAYLADAAIKQFDLSNDGNLDILELFKMNLQADVNGNGTLELNEQLALDSTLSGIDLGATPANETQYASLYTDLQKILTQFDSTKDKKLNDNEIKAFLVSKNLPEYLVNGLKANYDLNKDGEIDILELMKAYVDNDLNKSGKLELNEDLTLQGKLAGIDLQATPSNQQQYTLIYETVKKLLSTYNITNTKEMNTIEVKDYLLKNNLPADIIDNLLSQYDNNTNNNMDILEWMKTYIEFDVNKNGALEFNENLAFQSKIAGIDLNPTSANETQYKNLYTTVNNNVIKYDLTKDNKLNRDELIAYFKDQNLPASFADNFLAKYGVNGSIDRIHLLKAQVDFDADKNGSLDFSETLALNSSLINIAITSDVSNQKQYQPLYTTTNNIVKTYDRTSDRQLDEAELSNYFIANGFSASLAKEAINLYDVNNDSNLDTIELLKSNIDFDSNQNGVIELNESLAQNATYAQNNDVSSDISSANQNIGNYKAASTVITSYDLDKDKNLSNDELHTYFKSLGMTNSMADNFMSLNDSDKDGKLSNLEIMKGFIDADKNKSGVLDFDEKLNMYASLAGVDLNVTADNLKQVTALYNYATANLNTNDVNGDKKLSAADLGAYFKKLGMPQYMADNFIAQYDNNKDGSIDTMELTHAFLNIDQNQSGVIDFEDWMKLKNDASGINVNITADNKTQMTALYNSAASNLTSKDVNGDKKLSAAELGTYFKTLGMSQDMADNFIAQYDNNKNPDGTIGDGSIDVMELANAFVNIDQNQNGIIDFEDWMKLKSDASGINVNITADNKTQMTALYNYAVANFRYDANGDKKLSTTEVGNFFKTLGMPQYMADNFTAQYDNNKDGSIDIIEMTNAFVNTDQNKNGVIDFAEWMKIKSDTSGTNINVTADNLKQTTALYNYALSNLNTNDVNADKNLSSTELGNFLKTFKMTDTMVDNFIAKYDNNKDGSIDIMELTNAFMNLDINKSGAIDTDERINLLQNSSGIDLKSGYASSVQLAGLYSAAAGIFSYDLDKDSKINASEFETYLKAVGYTATQIQNAKNKFNSFDINGDGVIDYAEWMKTLENFDTNKNGLWEAADIAALKSSLS